MRIVTQYKDLTIAVLYSYLDGEKEHTRALDPWYPRVDHFICVDGRYRTPLTPEMRKKNLPNYSTDNSYDILEKHYGDKFIYDKLFGNQLEKRQKCFDIAAELGCDIVITVDTDDYIHPDYQDWNKFFRQIAYVYEYPDQLTYKMYYWIPKVEDWTPQYNAVPHETWVKYDRIHRDPGNLRYTHNHYTWCLKDVTDKEIDEWKWANPDKADDEYNPFYKLGNMMIDGIRFTTNRHLRTRNMLEFGDGWTYQNMHWEAYEFQTKPYWKNKNFELVYEGLKKNKYPNLEYYFSPADKAGKVYLIPYFINEKGEYVIIKTDQKEDGTVQYTEEILP